MASLMDTLPNEVILLIFSYLDKLEDRAVLSRVSRRFNSLSKVKTWRKKINITFDDIKKHELYKNINNKLLQEAKMSINLESLIIDKLVSSNPMEKIVKRKFEIYLPHLLCNIFKKCLKLNKVQCQIYRKNRIMFSSNNETMIINNRTSSEYLYRMITCFPVKFKTISNFGSNILPLKCIDRSSDVLESLGCSELTLNPESLSILKKCMKLNNFIINLSINVEPGIKLTDIPKLNLQFLSLPSTGNLLTQFHNHPKLLDMFLNDSLEDLDISDHVLAGYETLVLGKCKNLKTLDISSRNSLSNEEAIKFYKNILTLFEHSTKLTTISIISIRESFFDTFEEELLPHFQQYGHEATFDYVGLVWDYVIEKNE